MTETRNPYSRRAAAAIRGLRPLRVPGCRSLPARRLLVLCVAAVTPTLVAQRSYRTLTSLSSGPDVVQIEHVGSSAILATRDAGILESDGSVAGTRFHPHPQQYSVIEPLHPTSRSTFYLAARFLRSGRSQLWVLDRGARAPRQLRDFRDFGHGQNSVGEGIALGDRFLFSAWQRDTGWELWGSDGTVSGTRLIRNIWASFGVNGHSHPRSFYRLGGRVLFTADDGTHGREFWTTDGTTAGTRMLVDLVPGRASLSPLAESMIEFRDQLCFLRPSGSGFGLWTTDGLGVRWRGPVRGLKPAAGYRLLATETHLFVHDANRRLYVSNGSPVFSEVVGLAIDPRVVGTRIFFRECTDSRCLSTLNVATNMPQKIVIPGGDPGTVVAYLGDDRFLLGARSPSTGYELWVADLSVQSVKLWFDSAPGPSSGFPPQAGLVAGRLYFAGWSSRDGVQLRILDDPGASAVSFGSWCGDYYSQLGTGRPRLNTTQSLVNRGPATSVAVQWISPFGRTPLSANCVSGVDPRLGLVFGSGVGTFALPLRIPDDSALLGVRVLAETWRLRVSSAGGGLAKSNSLALGLGRD